MPISSCSPIVPGVQNFPGLFAHIVVVLFQSGLLITTGCSSAGSSPAAGASQVSSAEATTVDAKSTSAVDQGTTLDDVETHPHPLRLDSDVQSLIDERGKLLARERAIQYPLEPEVSRDERDANRRLCALRTAEISDYKTRGIFPPEISFADAKSAIQKSTVFRYLKQMPKGGALHIHSTAAGRIDWLIQEFLQREDTHVCWPTGANGHLPGEMRCCGPDYVPAGFQAVKDVVARDSDFPEKLKVLYTLTAADYSLADRWSKFGTIFNRLGPSLANQNLFIAYFTDAFATLAADGVDYVELRTGFPQLYADNGEPLAPDAVIPSYQAALAAVRKNSPDFDLRLIVSDWRGNSFDGIANSFSRTVQMQKKYADLIVGYDLVGQEDNSGPTGTLLSLWPLLQQICQSSQAPLPTLFLHDGESDWADDVNLIDAHVFNARRIGHGLDLYLFPALEKSFRQKGIALEVCPISNQALGYVSDLRMHPANGYIRRGVPCVLSSDDPLILGNEGLSYDFWVAYMAWDLDLIALRQLALNSIDHSARGDDQKIAARARFFTKWKEFVSLINREVPMPEGLLCL